MPTSVIPFAGMPASWAIQCKDGIAENSCVPFVAVFNPFSSVNSRWPGWKCTGAMTIDRLLFRPRMSVSGPEHREGLLSVGFSTRLTKKLHVAPDRNNLSNERKNPDLFWTIGGSGIIP
jgi:hypothetical protein